VRAFPELHRGNEGRAAKRCSDAQLHGASFDDDLEGVLDAPIRQRDGYLLVTDRVVQPGTE